MNFVALRMLTGDRAKYFGLIFAIAFCTFLLENQASIFANIMRRTASQILDVTDAEVWVMDPQTEYWEQTKALKDTDLTRVRGVPGVEWAVRLFKGTPVARTPSGKFAAAFLIGVDDASLAGAPRRMFMGSWKRLRDPDSVVIDRAGYILLFPGQPFELGRTVEMNDHKVTIVGISEAAAPFVSLPIMHARYSEAVTFLGRERTQLSFVIARPVEGVSPEALTERIAAHTGLRARTANEFMWDCIRYYMRNTGIPINFGITIGVALLVGTVVAGQTFYLFTLENLKQFGALKAIGVTNLRLIGMADGESPFGARDQNLFEAGFDASWEIDVFGGVRRDKEAALAQVQATEEARRDVLVGAGPDASADQLTPPAAIPLSPPALPAALPSELVSRRPDVRQAERELAAATARIGVARADLFPRSAILGNFGHLSDEPGDLPSVRSQCWSVIPGVRWPILSGGRIRANIGVQGARQEQAQEAYEKTILTALQDVADAPSARSRELDGQVPLRTAIVANRRALEVSLERYTSGVESVLSVLDAQRAVYAADDALARSERTLAVSAIAVYESPGGGWPSQSES
jgi:putative ABC transport system permease protein